MTLGAGFVRAAFVTFAFMGASASLAEPLKIRAAYIVPGTNIFSIFNAKPGVAKHYGQSYVLDAVRYQATPPMITALAVGDLDVGLLNSTALSLGVENAGMEDLRIFADEFRDGVDGYAASEFMVRGDAVKTAADLKGKTVATNAIGSLVDIASRAWLRKQGLEDKRDYNVVEAGLNTMKALLLEKKVDLVTAVPPFMFDPELRKSARALFTIRDAMGSTELGIWGARDSFLKKNRAAIIDFLEDAILVNKWYEDPKNHDEAVQIVATATKAPAAVWQDWIFTNRDFFRAAGVAPDVKAIQANIEVQRQLGFVKGALDTPRYIDLSYSEEARKRIP